MSRWTHVCGLIRIDFLPFLGESDESIKTLICNLLGTTVEWDSPSDIRTLSPERTTPTGSEGGVRYQYFVSTKSRNDIPRGCVSIWGDLRDFGTAEDVESILTWLNRLCGDGESRFSFGIRQGVVHVEDEAERNSAVIIFSDGEQRFIIQRSP